MSREKIKLVFSDHRGRIYSHPYLEAVGMKAGYFFPLGAKDLIRLPPGSELFHLPQRRPVGYDPRAKRPFVLERDTFSKGDKACFGIAAFISPGWTITYNSPFIERNNVPLLPMFSYAALAFYKNEFYVTALRVDRELRQDIAYMDMALVRKNVRTFKKIFSHNRLIRHLESCALTYGCPAARNFFLRRYEAPLPTSVSCNAQCLGCISYQPDKKCPITQPRIKFIPYPEEVAEVALFHIDNVKDPVVSFGQGCEGEPLLAGDVLEKSIKLIRAKTAKGMINLNTNAGRPDIVARLFDSGLNSMRVSLNSVRENYYRRYFKPKGYAFRDVLKSIKKAKKRGGFVSINYLTMPGFTDSREEARAFIRFLHSHYIDMVQWRNLNFDPAGYFSYLRVKPEHGEMFGIDNLIRFIKKSAPHIMAGYFNPSKARIRRHLTSLN